MTVLEEKMRKDKGSQRQTKRIVGHKSTRETEVTGVKGDPERSSVGTMEKEKGIREGMKRQSVGGKKKKQREELTTGYGWSFPKRKCALRLDN